jgi:hypothetical protein
MRALPESTNWITFGLIEIREMISKLRAALRPSPSAVERDDRLQRYMIQLLSATRGAGGPAQAATRVRGATAVTRAATRSTSSGASVSGAATVTAPAERAESAARS